MTKKLTAEQQATFDALTRDPQTFTITFWGYGGEIVVGSGIKPQTLDYLRQRGIGVLDFVFDADNQYEVPEEHRFVEDANWYECDDLAHSSGMELGISGRMMVMDKDGIVVFETSTSDQDLARHGIKVECAEMLDLQDLTVPLVFVAQSIEKGTFFEVKVTDYAFQPDKLVLKYDDINKWQILTGAEYRGEVLEDGYDAYSTNGKSMNCSIVDLDNDTVYQDPEDTSYYPDSSEYTAYHDGTVNPCYPGWYDCEFVDDYSWSSGRYYWDGNAWHREEYQKLVPITETLKQWRGLNWDTSDWANAPSKPSEVDAKAWPFRK